MQAGSSYPVNEILRELNYFEGFPDVREYFFMLVLISKMRRASDQLLSKGLASFSFIQLNREEL